MDRFVSLLVSGTAVGSVYVLVALGFLLIYKATGIINFAQGALVTLGAYLAAWAILDLDFPLYAGYAVALVLMFLVGVVLERLAFAPLRGRSVLVVLISTLAAALAIEALIVLWMGPLPRRLESPLGLGTFEVFGATVSHQHILIIVAAAVTVGVLSVVFRRSSFGRQMRALASDADTARLQGIQVTRISLVTWGVSGMLAGLAGILFAPITAVNPGLGFTPMLFAFGAAIIGGFGRLSGVVVGGLALGLLEAFGSGYVSGTFKEVYPFLVVLLVIAWRPEGFFGEEAQIRV